MGPFALSIPGYRQGIHPHKRQHGDATTRRRRDAASRSPSPRSDSDAGARFSSTTPRLPSDTINPLSHSPDTLHQLAVAGLSPEDELPSRAHPGFPHRPLGDGRPRKRRRTQRRASSSSASSRYAAVHGGDGGDSGAETDSTMAASRVGGTSHGDDESGDEDADYGGGRQHSARMRHLNTMTAIMHRCLREGDMVRAKRALGLLVRTRDVDVAIDDLWAVGLEILMRGGEQGVLLKPTRPSSSSSSSSRASSHYSSSDTDGEEDGDQDGEAGRRRRDGARIEKEKEEEARLSARWGTAANVPRAKAYLETLIQQHPYDSHRPRLTSAVDFWPALFGLEVHNLDAEFRAGLRQIRAEHGSPSPSPSPSPSRSPGDDYGADGMDLDSNDDDEYYAPDTGTLHGESNSGNSTRRKKKRRQRRRQSPEEREENSRDGDGDGDRDRDYHAAADALRAETRRGALELAARVDGVLENPPYSTHAELLRLRAHVSLFVGDLYLPSRLVGRYRLHCARRGGSTSTSTSASAVGGGGGAETSLRESERRLRVHVRGPEDRVALARRREEHGRARAFFDRAVGAGGWLEEWVVRLLDEDEDEDEE